MLKRVGIPDPSRRFNLYPHELSGGMRQRCALARLLANEPEVWLMDEPLAAVDLQTRNILQDELLRLWGDGGDPVGVSSHPSSSFALMLPVEPCVSPRS